MALRAAGRLTELQRALTEWFDTYNGYDPEFGWWARDPYKQVTQALEAYGKVLREKAAGIDPVYFGVVFIINNAIGLITPPVGTVLNTVAGVGKVSMDEVTRGVWPFMVAQFALLFLVVQAACI